jgi:hypothetical protein
LGQVDLRAGSGSGQDPLGFRRFKAAHAKVMSCSAPDSRVPDIDTTKDARLALIGVQAEIEAVTIKNDEGDVGSTRSDQAFGQREFTEHRLSLCLKAPQYLEHGLDKRDG